uniref:Uncharacterized protein n=1 Tax=Aureoumbra lagunensis TaxID=44058 RepID=A0A7S3K6L4_9STRA|mmetsp:Transcript_7392/g.10277  ORF Transcript_7392/g.10277 Transcript_7392/m.10277 type:complete len:289 (-) Transcript_7392:126-992(-)
MLQRKILFIFFLGIENVCPWSPPYSSALRPKITVAAEKDEGSTSEENLVKRLWSGARRRISSSQSGEELKIEKPLGEEENLAMYAELEQRKRSMDDKDSMADKSIYDALAKKADFPRISKKLNEALANRSLFLGQQELSKTSLNETVFNDFLPSSGQSPGEVITGVLRALRDDGIEPEEGAFQCRGVETLLKFMSPKSELGGPDADPVSIATFFSNSEYDVLLNWNDIVFDTPLRLSTDSTKAYQTTRLKNSKNGEWKKVKWNLSLQSRSNDDGGDYWLIDSMTIARR